MPRASDPVLKELARRVCVARERAGLTQEAVAARASIDYKRYQRIEQGVVNPTIKTLERVAGAMDLEVWQLLSSGGAKR